MGNRNEKIKTVKPFDPKRPNVLSIVWDDGTSTEWDLATLPDDIRDRLVYHGARRKFGDAHAGGTSEYGSIAGCRGESERVFESAKAGIWSAGRSSTPWIVEYMAETYDVSIEVATTTFGKLDAKRQRKIRLSPAAKLWKLERDRKRYELQADTETDDLAGLFTKK